MTEGGICVSLPLTSSSAHTKPLITHWIIISTTAHNVWSAQEVYDSEKISFSVLTLLTPFVALHSFYEQEMKQSIGL